MGFGKLLLIGGVGVGLAALLMHSKSANAASGTAPAVPAGAKVETFPPPLAGTGMAMLKRSSWHVPADASGQQAGTFALTQNAANPNDWVLGFRNDSGGGVGIIAWSQTPNGGLMAQAAAAGL